MAPEFSQTMLLKIEAVGAQGRIFMQNKEGVGVIWMYGQGQYAFSDWIHVLPFFLGSISTHSSQKYTNFPASPESSINCRPRTLQLQPIQFISQKSYPTGAFESCNFQLKTELARCHEDFGSWWMVWVSFTWQGMELFQSTKILIEFFRF